MQPSPSVIRENGVNVVAMECMASGVGAIYYRWEKYMSSSNSWIKPSRRAVDTTSSKLIFSLITEEDEGVYRCITTNDDGSTMSNNATITVYGKEIQQFNLHLLLL